MTWFAFCRSQMFGLLLAGGYVVWGSPTAVNQQIVMYLLSRILIAMVKVLAKRRVLPFCLVSEQKVCELITVLFSAPSVLVLVLLLYLLPRCYCHWSCAVILPLPQFPQCLYVARACFFPAATALVFMCSVLYFRLSLSCDCCCC